SLARSATISEWRNLSINNLSFKYDDLAELSLNNISFRIEKGERIAIIGESGSGKTTFLKVLHGMYPKASGTLVIDQEEPISTSFADIDLTTMLVPQEPEIFSS